MQSVQREIFDNDATRLDQPDEFASRCEKLRDQIVKTMITTKGNRILDVGCSSGKFLMQYCLENHCYGVDISERALQHINAPGISTFLCDIDEDNLPFDDEYFDFIYSSHTIEHLIDTHHFMEEVYRCLRLAGRLILVAPNINQPISLLMQLFLDLPPKNSARPYSAHVRDFSLRILRRMFEIHNFRIATICGVGMYPFSGSVAQMFLKKFPRFAENIVICGVKQPAKIKARRLYDDVRDLLSCCE